MKLEYEVYASDDNFKNGFKDGYIRIYNAENEKYGFICVK